jgi:hypothetical protein
MHLLEEWHNLAGKFLSHLESLRVQHDLSDQLSVWFGHGQATEELLQVVGQVGSASIARVHGDEDCHVWVDLHMFADQLYTDEVWRT